MTRRWTDFTSLVILLILLMLAVTRLEITHWAENLNIAAKLIVLGAILGYAVGVSRLRSGWAALIQFGYSIIIPPAIAVFDLTPSGPLVDRLLQLWDRIYTAGSLLVTNQPVTDSILFILGMALLYWFMGNLAGYSLSRRGNPWLAVLILGGAMILIEHYQIGSRQIFFTAAYAIISLVLLGRLYFLRIRDQLKAEDIKVGDESSLDFIHGVIIAAILIGLAGWIIPGVARAIFVPDEFPTALSARWDRFSKNFQNLVFSLDQSTQTTDIYSGSTMDLGTGQPQGVNVVLNVDASQSAPLNNSFYWRLRVYDIYSNSQWRTGPVTSAYYTAMQELPKPNYSNLLPIDFKFTSSMSQMDLLYIPGTPLVIDKHVQARITSQGADQADIIALITSPPIPSGGTYSTTAAVSTANAADLSNAGTNYPQWILDRYLQLPVNLPQRIRDLSAQLTASGATPYAKTVAVTNYLRANITYQTTIDTPPAGRDSIDWFLFDYKKGFCNYYASAEVLLLRASGIPARLAVGYAQGVQTSQGRFSVREKDSHAWPEVYFPGYGWIPFEPTSGLAAVDYSGAGGTNSTQGSGSQSGTGGAPGGGQGGGASGRPLRLLDRLDSAITGITPAPQLTLFGKILLGVSLAAILALIVLLIIIIKKHGKAWARRITGTAARIYHALTRLPLFGDLFLTFKLTTEESSFLVIERGLGWLGARLPAGATAAEIADMLIKELPETEKDAHTLLKAYQESVYGRKKKKNTGSRVAVFRINRAVLRAYLRKIFEPVERLDNRFN